MAEKRMFSKNLIDSDLFLDMPATAQILYFHLAMRADDDGFINNPKAIMRLSGCSDGDMKILTEKQFIISFDSGIVLIRHWRLHNYIRSDRYKPSECEEKSLVFLDENSVYQLSTGGTPSGIPTVNHVDTQDRLDLDIDIDLDIERDLERDRDIESVCEENSTEIKAEKIKAHSRFSPPNIEQVKNYCNERRNCIDPQRFIDYYTSNGWKVGKNAMKDWKAAVRTWESRDSCVGSSPKNHDSGERSYSLEKWHEMYDGVNLDTLKFEAENTA